MNPWGLIIIALGLILIVIGFKGSQHSVIQAFKGMRKGTGNPPSAPSNTPGTGNNPGAKPGSSGTQFNT